LELINILANAWGELNNFSWFLALLDKEPDRTLSHSTLKLLSNSS